MYLKVIVYFRKLRQDLKSLAYGYNNNQYMENLKKDKGLSNMIDNIKKKNISHLWYDYTEGDKTIVIESCKTNCEELKEIFKEYEEKNGVKIDCNEYFSN